MLRSSVDSFQKITVFSCFICVLAFNLCEARVGREAAKVGFLFVLFGRVVGIIQGCMFVSGGW